MSQASHSSNAQRTALGDSVTLSNSLLSQALKGQDFKTFLENFKAILAGKSKQQLLEYFEGLKRHTLQSRQNSSKSFKDDQSFMDQQLREGASGTVYFHNANDPENADADTRASMVLLNDQPTVIIHDLHGDIDNLIKTLETFGPDANYLFLGDYVDGGDESFLTSAFVAYLQALSPNQVFMGIGNHEYCDNKDVGDFPDGWLWSTYLALNQNKPQHANEEEFSIDHLKQLSLKIRQAGLVQMGGVDSNGKKFIVTHSKPITKANEDKIKSAWEDKGAKARGKGIEVCTLDQMADICKREGISYLTRGHTYDDPQTYEKDGVNIFSRQTVGGGSAASVLKYTFYPSTVTVYAQGKWLAYNLENNLKKAQIESIAAQENAQDLLAMPYDPQEFFSDPLIVEVENESRHLQTRYNSLYNNRYLGLKVVPLINLVRQLKKFCKSDSVSIQDFIGSIDKLSEYVKPKAREKYFDRDSCIASIFFSSLQAKFDSKLLLLASENNEAYQGFISSMYDAYSTSIHYLERQGVAHIPIVGLIKEARKQLTLKSIDRRFEFASVQEALEFFQTLCSGNFLKDLLPEIIDRFIKKIVPEVDFNTLAETWCNSEDDLSVDSIIQLDDFNFCNSCNNYLQQVNQNIILSRVLSVYPAVTEWVQKRFTQVALKKILTLLEGQSKTAINLNALVKNLNAMGLSENNQDLVAVCSRLENLILDNLKEYSPNDILVAANQAKNPLVKSTLFLSLRSTVVTQLAGVQRDQSFSPHPFGKVKAISWEAGKSPQENHASGFDSALIYHCHALLRDDKQSLKFIWDNLAHLNGSEVIEVISSICKFGEKNLPEQGKDIIFRLLERCWIWGKNYWQMLTPAQKAELFFINHPYVNYCILNNGKLHREVVAALKDGIKRDDEHAKVVARENIASHSEARIPFALKLLDNPQWFRIVSSEADQINFVKRCVAFLQEFNGRWINGRLDNLNEALEKVRQILTNNALREKIKEHIKDPGLLAEVRRSFEIVLASGYDTKRTSSDSLTLKYFEGLSHSCVGYFNPAVHSAEKFSPLFDQFMFFYELPCFSSQYQDQWKTSVDLSLVQQSFVGNNEAHIDPISKDVFARAHVQLCCSGKTVVATDVGAIKNFMVSSFPAGQDVTNQGLREKNAIIQRFLFQYFNQNLIAGLDYQHQRMQQVIYQLQNGCASDKSIPLSSSDPT